LLNIAAIKHISKRKILKMKKQLMRVVNTTMFSKFIKTTVVVLMLSGSYAVSYATPVFAGIENPGPGVGKTMVTHVSSDSKSQLFEVKVENATGEKFQIVVKDDNGRTLYRGNFTEKAFSKKFRLPKGESEKVTFIIKNEAGTESETFEINSSVRFVEEVVVKKVN